MQKVLVGVGITVGLYLGYCLLNYEYEALIVGQHIKYKQGNPASLRPFVIAFYGLATIIPPLFSHVKRMWILGVLILISYLITAIFYEHYILSVWCFFSSFISLSVYFILLGVSNAEKEKFQKIMIVN